ncbi:uncharacterized protein LOC131207206 [Anopheles bellator]|uniref:uncharacterized protein LOC131207206 n=1 Tax=Anopheles bellator TaxID=139047 RepID=UPI0026474DDD|nr:uncharacterized protein LOC131207206 [Anopheles bellator]
MSVSVTVHEIRPPSPIADALRNPLDDLETVRKAANEKLRIRRLVQVRQQSKELAAKVRQGYQQAKEKELAKIEKTKRDELQAWKRQQIRHLQTEYARCVSEVGEAHKAAEAAEECAVWFEEKRAAQQAVALQRGRQAEETVARERDRKEAANEAKKKKKYVPSKSIAVQTAIIPEPEPIPGPSKSHAQELPTGPTSTLSPFEQFRLTKGKSSLAKERTVASLTISSDSEDDELCDITGRADKENVPAAGKRYSATDFTSPSADGQSVPPQRLKPFTQISDLIQQRRQQRQDDRQPTMSKGPGQRPYGSCGMQKVVQFDDVSEYNTLSFPTSSVMTNDDALHPAPRVPETDDELPRKVAPQPKASNHEKPIVKRGKAALPTEARRTSSCGPTSGSSVSYGAETKVQYYDHNTRFRKEYDQPIAFVRREERREDERSAMEEANRYEKLQQELANARSIPIVDRGKPALEKQQIRKDYEKLSHELDHLTREQNRLKSLAGPSKSHPTEAVIKQKAAARQRKASEVIENLLRQRSLVTCPVVRQPHDDSARATVHPAAINVAEGSRIANVSSDSCASIVLGTFERPAIPLPVDKAPGVDIGDASGLDKITQLKALLEQLNEQRKLLTVEIDKATTKVALDAERTAENGGHRTAVVELEKLKRRQEELNAQQQLLQQREREVEALGRELREKMAILDRKKRPGDDKEKEVASKRNTHAKLPTVHVAAKGQKDKIEVEVEQPSTASTVDSGSSSGEVSAISGSEIPVKIIITVNEKPTSKKLKHKKKNKILNKSQKKVSIELESSDPPPAKPTIAEHTKETKTTVKQVTEGDFSLGSTSTSSTIYRTLPPKIGQLKINNLLGELQPERGHSSRPVPGKPKHQLRKRDTNIAAVPPTTGRHAARPGTNLNPHLMRYIVRLLGMSHQSIDQLGVSSSTVSTPNASVVNVSANRSGGTVVEPTNNDLERSARLRKFIDDNYNFLQEIDDTLRRHSDQSANSSSGAERNERSTIEGDRNDTIDPEVSRVEDVWMSTLRRREHAMRKSNDKKDEGRDKTDASKPKTNKKVSEKATTETPMSLLIPAPISAVAEQPIVAPIQPPRPRSFGTPIQTRAQEPTVKATSLKSILKSPKRDPPTRVAKIITPQGHVEVINLSDHEEQEILERYSQLTERGSQRIAELSQMISQVREEKRRLIEDSLSSFEQQESSTKYMDLPPVIGRPSNMVSSDAPAAAPVHSPAVPVAQPILSPPMPSAALLDDPVSEEIDNIISSKQIGLSKDSGIAMSRPLTASDIRESPSEEGSQVKEPPPFEPFLKDIPKPPGGECALAWKVSHAVTRRSQPAPAPPVAITRYSPHLEEAPMHELSTIPEVETPAAATTKANVSSLSVSGPDRPSDGRAEQVLIEARNKLLTEAAAEDLSVPDLGYDRFPVFEEYVRQTETEKAPTNDTVDLRLNVTGEQTLTNLLQYRRFAGPAPAFDITEDHAGSTSEANGSDGTLPDVVAELRKLNIVIKPFDHSLDDSNRSTPFSDQASGQQEPPMQKVPVMNPPPASGGSEDPAELMELLSTSLGPDLQRIPGLQWLSSMLRRHQQRQQQHPPGTDNSSTSSSMSLVEAVKDRRQSLQLQETDGDCGKPLNLTKFIQRELLIRTLQPSLSSSPISHSTLLHSLLDLSNVTSSGGGTPSPMGELLSHTQASDRNVQRTSTPVASKSITSGTSGHPRGTLTGGDSAGQEGISNVTTGGALFSSESRISSVHWSSSSGSSEGKLAISDVRLERKTQ